MLVFLGIILIIFSLCKFPVARTEAEVWTLFLLLAAGGGMILFAMLN